MIFFDFINIHTVFYILGTLEGELIKKIIELILFVLITYMVLSEYTKDQRNELKYLFVAFAVLSFQKLVSTIVLLGVIFGNIGRITYLEYLPIIDNSIEIFALILLANAFLFPLIKREYPSFRRYLVSKAIVPAGLFLLFATMLVTEIATTGYNYNVNYWGSLIFTMAKIVLLIYAIYMLSVRTDIPIRYRYSAIIAFLVYFITPFLRLINIAFYEGVSDKLLVAEHPFPLIAVLLFTRIIYLKLVDKVSLRAELKHEMELGKMKDKFVSVVSHELRTPLTSINLYSGLLKDGKLGKVNPKQKSSLAVIKNETVRLSGLINDILDLSKLEEGKMKLRIQSFDLHSFCANNPACYLAKQKKIKIINKVPKDLRVNVDIDKFQQVLVNLLSNAIKYTNNKGEITLSAKSNNKNWEMTVSDTGTGISEESLDKIFDKFYQAEHYMTRKEQGTGLGLTIVSEIVKLHRGKIEVKSKLGKGTTFTVIIPKGL